MDILLLVIAIAGLVAVGLYFGLKQRVPDPPKAKAPQRPGSIPVRKASEKINVPEPVPLEPVPPAPGPQGLSGATSRLWIVPDVPFPSSDKAQGFKTGDGMALVVRAADNFDKPLAGIQVRGIIDMTTGSALPTSPKTQATGPDGTAAFRYTMREEDQLEHGSKLIRAVLLDGGKTYTTQPAVLWDALTY